MPRWAASQSAVERQVNRFAGGWSVASARGCWGDDGGVVIVFRVRASAAERVGFSYWPSLEAVLSLHVLVEPKHHPVQHGWVRAMRGLSPALKRRNDAPVESRHVRMFRLVRQDSVDRVQAHAGADRRVRPAALARRTR
jgi:Family of unknown function (DUF5937)